MNIKCNLIIKNLGIVLWKLRYPVILKSSVPFQVLINLRLLIISDCIVSLKDTFVKDVMYTMCFNDTEVYVITVDQLNHLVMPDQLFILCWCIGIKKQFKLNLRFLYTPSLMALKCNMNFKRNFLNQIYRVTYGIG